MTLPFRPVHLKFQVATRGGRCQPGVSRARPGGQSGGGFSARDTVQMWSQGNRTHSLSWQVKPSATLRLYHRQQTGTPPQNHKNTFTLTFDPAGTGHGLYTEIMDLSSIGALGIHRATTIEFNNLKRQWEVKDIGGEIHRA